MIAKGKKKGASAKSIAKFKKESVVKSEENASKTYVCPVIEEDIVKITRKELPINLTVRRLDNINPAEYGEEVIVQVLFSKTFKCNSSNIVLSEKNDNAVGWQVEIPFSPTDFESRDQLASNPVLFNLFKAPELPTESQEQISSNVEPIIFGRCNLDLYPFLIGETKINETLIVEQHFYSSADAMISWPLLPRLAVTAEISEPFFTPEEVADSNILTITLESMYNALPQMSSAFDYRASTSCPQSLEQGGARDVSFDACVWTKYHDRHWAKRWASLVDVEGRAAYSKHRIDRDMTSLQNTLGEDVVQKMRIAGPRIEWNIFQQCCLTKDSTERVFDYISKYSYWPLEILISPAALSNVPYSFDKEIRLAAYFDVSSLLKAGETKARVISQVFTYCQSDMEARCGIQRQICQRVHMKEPALQQDNNDSKTKFGHPSTSSRSSPIRNVRRTSSLRNSIGKESSMTDNRVGKKKHSKSKSAIKVSSQIDTTMLLKQEEMENLMSSLNNLLGPAGETKPLFNDNGDPVFVIIELSLQKPLTTPWRRSSADTLTIADVLPHRKLRAEQVVSPCVAAKQYSRCVAAATGVLADAYAAYKSRCGEPGCDCTYCVCPQQDKTFVNSIVLNGTYQAVRAALHNILPMMVREKTLREVPRSPGEDMKNFISESYVHCVKEMYNIVHSFSAGHIKQESYSHSKKMKLYADEAAEEGDRKLGEKLYLLRIAKDMYNPDVWLQYAIFCMLSDHDSAFEVVKEVLALDARHMLGLLMYATMLAERGEIKSAKMCFIVLLSHYPDFAAGWTTFYLFLIQSNQFDDADVVLQTAFSCTDSIPSRRVSVTPFSWVCDVYPASSMFTATAELLLKLRLVNVAQMALAQELIHYDKSVGYSYLLAVNHYLHGRYVDVVSHLDEYVSMKCSEYALWVLVGHCEYKLGNYDVAIECYQSEFAKYREKVKYHLVNIRLGACYNKERCYFRTKYLFLRLNRNLQSPRSWLLHGIACYEMGELAAALKALINGTKMNSLCPVTWGYLALIYIVLRDMPEFHACYAQALRAELQDADLLSRIQTEQEKIDIAAAIEQETISHSKCTKERKGCGIDRSKSILKSKLTVNT